METMTVWQAYSLLELDAFASIKRVKQSYRRAAKLYHPDMNASYSDAEKFTEVVSAYKTILEDRKKNPSGRSNIMKNKGQPEYSNGSNSERSNDAPKQETRERCSASAKRKVKKAPIVKKGPKVKLGVRANNLLTYDELVIRFDKGPNVWVKAEAAQLLFNNFNDHFEFFAIPRLAGAKGRILIVLISLLGERGSVDSLNAIAPYLSSGDTHVCCSAFKALDKAGDLGVEIIDKYLNTPPAILHRLTGLFFKSDLEREVVGSKLISSEKLRRLWAVKKKTGLPLRDLLKGIGVEFSASA